MGRKGRQGGVVLPEGSRPASSGVSFCSEGATGGRVLPSDSGLALPVEALTSDVRKASPGSAALPKRPGPEAATRGRSSFGPEACGGVIRTGRREA